MADQFLSERDFTTQIAGGHMLINLPDNESPTGFKTYRIRTVDILRGSGNVPLKLRNISANFSQVLPIDSWVDQFSISVVSGTPTIKIGLTPNGNEIIDTQIITSLLAVSIENYISVDTTYYFTISGGVVKIRFDFQINYS